MPPQEKTGSGSGEPASFWWTISPSDDEDLSIRPRCIYIGTTGDLTMADGAGNVVRFVSIAVGYHPLRPTRIMATGTTAGAIVGLY